MQEKSFVTTLDGSSGDANALNSSVPMVAATPGGIVGLLIMIGCVCFAFKRVH